MQRKKSQKNEETQSKKGKKGGQSSKKNKSQVNGDILEYIEVDEFTLDDLPGSENR